MAVVVTNLTGNKSDVSASSFATASVTPKTNDLILLSVSARRGDSVNPTVPTVTGCGLTWVQVGTDVQWDTVGTSRKTLFLFRALGVASAGAITINFGAQTITNCNWIVDDISGIDASGTNGSGAIVQTVSNNTQTGAQTSESATLAAFDNANNIGYGAFTNDGPSVFTVGSGFTSVGTNAGSAADGLSEYKVNTTVVSATFSNVAGMNSGVIAVEIKAAVGVRSSSSNHAATGTAISVTAPSGVAVGDVVVVVIHGNNQTSTADNNGTTPFTKDLNDYQPNPTSGHVVAVYSRRIQVGDPATYNFTLGTSGRWAIVAVAYVNVNATSIYDVSPVTGNAVNADSPGSATIVVPSITTLTANALHQTFGASDDGVGGAMTTPTGYLINGTPTDQPLGVATKPIPSAGATGTTTFTPTTTAADIGLSFAIKDINAATAGSTFVPRRSLMGVGL